MCFREILFLLRNGYRWNDLDELKDCPLLAAVRTIDQVGPMGQILPNVLDEYQKTIGYDVRELLGAATYVEGRKEGF